jgi:hypothetical protein
VRREQLQPQAPYFSKEDSLMTVQLIADFLRVNRAGEDGDGNAEWRLDFEVLGAGRTQTQRFTNNSVDNNEIFPLGFEFTIDEDFAPERLVVVQTNGTEEDPFPNPDDDLQSTQDIFRPVDRASPGMGEPGANFQTTTGTGNFSYTVDWFIDIA